MLRGRQHGVAQRIDQTASSSSCRAVEKSIPVAGRDRHQAAMRVWSRAVRRPARSAIRHRGIKSGAVRDGRPCLAPAGLAGCCQRGAAVLRAFTAKPMYDRPASAQTVQTQPLAVDIRLCKITQCVLTSDINTAWLACFIGAKTVCFSVIPPRIITGVCQNDTNENVCRIAWRFSPLLS